jgi:FMN phosphatase YigB (HAD superfamily)
MSYQERFSPELESAFASWLKARDIQVGLFDLDDTLVDTNALFGSQIALFLELCQRSVPHIDSATLQSEFQRIDKQSYELFGVSLKKWQYVVDQMVELYAIEDLSEGLEMLHGIYNNAANPHDGARETLELCRKSGLRLGLVTHANQAWTDIKLDQAGLRDYFEHIKIIDIEEHKYKGSQHWQEAVDSFGVASHNAMAVGDNIKGDILAAHQIGIKTLAWVPSRWHIYSEGSLPEGAVVVDKIGNLVSTLVGNGL